MPERHAKRYRPSSASRWTVCTASALLEETLPDTTTPYAAEGTVAHALCEQKLRCMLEGTDFPKNDCDNEMWESANKYRDFVEEELNAAKARTPDAKLLIEHEFNLSDFAPESFGTSDAVIVGDDVLEVIDFKYGKGVRVDAEGNSQLRLYALGTYSDLSELYDFTVVKTVIVQPRLDHISVEVISVEELLNWAKEVITPAVQDIERGEVEYVIGDHCRFCKAAGTCRARAEDAFQVIDKTDTKPALLSDEEIPAILDKLDNVEKWITALRQYAEDKAILEGKHWEGYKLVESRTVRKIEDQLRALQVLEKAGFNAEEVTTVKLKGIGELEKILGKPRFNELLGTLTVKPVGAPTLVKESDKRPEYIKIENTFKED